MSAFRSKMSQIIRNQHKPINCIIIIMLQYDRKLQMEAFEIANRTEALVE